MGEVDCRRREILRLDEAIEDTRRPVGWQNIRQQRKALRVLRETVLLERVGDETAFLAPEPREDRLRDFARRLIDAGEADASARLQRQGECLVVDDMRANNDRFDLEGRIRYCGEQPSGQLHARWGVLGVGVDVDNGQRQFRLKGAKKWFEAQPGYVRAAN